MKSVAFLKKIDFGKRASTGKLYTKISFGGSLKLLMSGQIFAIICCFASNKILMIVENFFLCQHCILRNNRMKKRQLVSRKTTDQSIIFI